MKKRVIGALLCGILAVSVMGCTAKNESPESNNGTNVEQGSDKTETISVSVKEVVEKVIEKGYVRMAMPVDDTIAKDMYHINLDDVEEYAIAETGISPGPGLIVMVKAKEGKLDAVKSSVEKIKEDKVGKAFYPAEEEAAKNSTVQVKGNVVYYTLFNSEINEEAQGFIAEMLK